MKEVEEWRILEEPQISQLKICRVFYMSSTRTGLVNKLLHYILFAIECILRSALV